MKALGIQPELRGSAESSHAYRGTEVGGLGDDKIFEQWYVVCYFYRISCQFHYGRIILFSNYFVHCDGFGCWTSSNVPLVHGLGTGLANLELNSPGEDTNSKTINACNSGIIGEPGMALEIYLVHLNEKSHVDGAWNSVVPLAWADIFNQGINAWEKRLVCIETLSDFRKASCAS